MNAGTWRTTTGFKLQASDLPPGASSRNRVNVGDGSVQAFAYGVGPDNRFDLPIDELRVIAAGSSLTLDLFGGVDLLDRFRRGANIRSVKDVLIRIESGGDTNGVRIGGAGSNAWLANFGTTADTWDIFPSGPPFQAGLPTGIAVTATSKNLLLTNRSGTTAVTVSIRIAGSAAVTGNVTGIPGMPLYA